MAVGAGGARAQSRHLPRSLRGMPQMRRQWMFQEALHEEGLRKYLAAASDRTCMLLPLLAGGGADPRLLVVDLDEDLRLTGT